MFVGGMVCVHPWCQATTQTQLFSVIEEPRSVLGIQSSHHIAIRVSSFVVSNLFASPFVQYTDSHTCGIVRTICVLVESVVFGVELFGLATWRDCLFGWSANPGFKVRDNDVLCFNKSSGFAIRAFGITMFRGSVFLCLHCFLD